MLLPSFTLKEDAASVLALSDDFLAGIVAQHVGFHCVAIGQLELAARSLSIVKAHILDRNGIFFRHRAKGMNHQSLNLDVDREILELRFE